MSILRSWLALLLLACGAPAAPVEEAPVDEAPPEEAPPPEGSSVRVRVADEANLTDVDPAILRAMEDAVRALFTDEWQAERMRVEAVLHELSDDGVQRRAAVRVTIVRISDEHICTVLAGGAEAALAAGSPLAIVEAAMRSALRNFVSEMSDCVRSA